MDRDLPPADETTQAEWLAITPAWLFSCAAHLVLFICGSLIVRGSLPANSPDDAARSGEIVLARREANETRYVNASDERHEVLRPVTDASATTSAGLAVTDPPPLLAGIKLPELAGNVPIGDGVVGAVPQTGSGRGHPSAGQCGCRSCDSCRGRAYSSRKNPDGTDGGVSLFGSQPAEGRSFVFAIDRSNSMGSEGLGAIQAAAKELASGASISFRQSKPFKSWLTTSRSLISPTVS